MPRTIFIARLIGPTFVVIALSMLANQAISRAMIGEFLGSNALIFLSGLLSLVAGLAIVNVHNDWNADWRLMVTVFGWLMVIGGIIRILAPRVAASVGAAMYEPQAVFITVAVVTLLLGAFLSYKGYSQ